MAGVLGLRNEIGGNMEFGVLFTSHPNPKEEPYPHRDVHARTTDEILEAERLGYDTAWIAEHHFATSYAILPAFFPYLAYLAAQAGRINLGAAELTLPLHTLSSIESLAAQTSLYKRELAQATPERRKNPAAGNIDIARWVYIADTDKEARADTEEAIVRHISHFGGSGTGGYLGSVSEKGSAIKYDDLASTLLHGSAETVIARLREVQARTGMTSLLLHYPPYYGRDKAMKSLKLFAERVIPAFRPPARRAAAE